MTVVYHSKSQFKTLDMPKTKKEDPYKPNLTRPVEVEDYDARELNRLLLQIDEDFHNTKSRIPDPQTSSFKIAHLRELKEAYVAAIQVLYRVADDYDGDTDDDKATLMDLRDCYWKNYKIYSKYTASILYGAESADRVFGSSTKIIPESYQKKLRLEYEKRDTKKGQGKRGGNQGGGGGNSNRNQRRKKNRKQKKDAAKDDDDEDDEEPQQSAKASKRSKKDALCFK